MAPTRSTSLVVLPGATDMSAPPYRAHLKLASHISAAGWQEIHPLISALENVKVKTMWMLGVLCAKRLNISPPLPSSIMWCISLLAGSSKPDLMLEHNQCLPGRFFPTLSKRSSCVIRVVCLQLIDAFRLISVLSTPH